MKEELCGCCEGMEKLTPQPTANRPGLDALSYRNGTHATFLETMRARLTDLYLEVPVEEGSEEKKRIYPLRSLTTRDATDPAIALLDAWAILGDVLTFYQERIANEGYLRTATERRSIQELARLVGYKLRPGVAASVYPAFTLEKDYEVEIPVGTRAQSLPGPGELPQSFETAEPLLSRAEWSELKPRLMRPQYITSTTHTIYLKGVNTYLKPNDPLLIIDSFGESHFRRVLRTETDAKADRTKVILTVKGEVDLNLVELETLIQPAQIPEEEGPYSVAIGDRAAKEIGEAMDSLLALLRNVNQPPNVLKNAVQAQMPRLEQTIRIYKALNFENMVAWADKIRRQLNAILRRLELRLEGLNTVSGQVKDLKKLVNAIEYLLQRFPERPYRKAFAKEIGESELEAVKQSMQALIDTLKNNDIEDDEKACVIRATILRLDQLEYVFEELGFEIPSTWVRQLSEALKEAIPESTISVIAKIRPTISLSLLSSLTGVLKPLLKAPAIQPFNALRLKRTVTRIFSPKADIAPRLLTTLKPALHFTLYPALRNIATKPGPAKVCALRSTVSLFGHNAPKEPQYEPATIIVDVETARNPNAGNLKSWDSWPEWKPADDEAANVVFLDNAYEKIMLGSYIIVQKPGAFAPQIFGDIEVITRPRSAYGLSAKTTEITLPNGKTWWDPSYETTDDFKFIRGTVVYAQSELLELAHEPIETDVQGPTIDIDGLYDGLESGRWLIVSGERTDITGTSGVRASERVMLAGVTQAVQQVTLPDGSTEDLPGDKLHSTVALANDLAYSYKRDSVTIYGNVVKATHGETREEVLGSGDGSKELQSFTLSQSPLTHLAAATPVGAESTLEVRVNDVRWHEAGNLFKLGPNDRGYVTRTDNEDKASIVFGDGRHGPRLPTGPENVKAVYRFGIGKAGNVAAEQISMLATKPLGVKSVINPLPATGGADRENRDQARRNAPLALMALDRLVSVPDYADFTRTYAGIGKASAMRLSDGRRQVIHVTIAGADDIPIDTNSDLYTNLCQALHQHGDPYQPIQVDVRELMLLVISAKVRLLPDYQWESVEPQIRATLLKVFSFDRRELGQDVLLSEVISVIQGVAGVAYVDVDILDNVSEDTSPDELEKLADDLKLSPRIVAKMGRIQTYPVVKRSGEMFFSIAARYGITGGELRRLNPDIGMLEVDTRLRIPRVIRPAQLAYLSPDVTDTLILQELTP